MVGWMSDNVMIEVSSLDTPKGQASEINAIFDGDPPERVRGAVERIAKRNELHYLWAIYNTLRHVPLAVAERFVFVTVRLQFEDDAMQGDSIDFVGEFLESIHASILRRKKTPVDVALRASYRLVHNRLASWDEATELAAHLLKKPITKEAWRRRVVRWAERQGLGAIRIYQTRPKTSI